MQVGGLFILNTSGQIQSLSDDNDNVCTPETVYKVPICPRGNLLYKQIYLTTDPKVTLQGYIGDLKWLLYK